MKTEAKAHASGGGGTLLYLEPCRPARRVDAEGIDALDPQGMIRSALAGLGDPQTSAEDLFVAWIMALPRGTDEAVAARTLLAAYLPGNREPLAALGRRVVALLVEAAGGAGKNAGGSPGGRPRSQRPSSRRRALRGLAS